MKNAPGLNRERPQPMVGWYDPDQLVRTSFAVLVSTIFGRHSDFRILESLAVEDITIDESLAGAEGDEIWLDYVADPGDGWDSTYAVAYWLSQPALQLKDPAGKTYNTNRGNVLVFGGDEVYPVASKQAYKQRLVLPYETALRRTDAPHPCVYAIPGNHDWYDSLVSFIRLFGTREWFAGWRAKQTRSYFAVKLPHGWWLLGTDVQLGSDLDEPQLAFFRDVVAPRMKASDRVILCNAEPHWIYAHIYGKSDTNYSENNLAFLEQKVLKRKVAVFLAGDLHHYRRHEAGDGTQKICSGGGGAFLHPTHGQNVEQLAGGFRLKASYPDVKTSRRLCWRNVLFLFLNPWFGLVTGLFYVLAAWATKVDLSSYGLQQCAQALALAINTAVNSPVAVFWILAILGGFLLFTDTHSRVYRWIAGPIHGLVHLLAVFLIAWVVTYLTVKAGLPFGSSGQLLLAGACVFLAGWIVGSFIMGIYLLVSLNLFRRHATEAFSSLAIKDWKNFLRLKIDATGQLTIYPVALERVPRKWEDGPVDGTGPLLLPDDPRATPPALIEEPVIVRT